MSAYDFDLFTIGAGSGGVRASRMAAEFGARVAIAEERYLGGTCVNVGCVPKKLMVYASHVREDLHTFAGFGWDIGSSAFDWPRFLQRKNLDIARLNAVYGNVLDQAGVTRLTGRARLVGDHEVEIDGRRVTAEHVLVATGSWPRRPTLPGIDHAITSNEAFHLEELPKRTLIVGGGYIAVEFACIFQGLGVDTALSYRGDLFLRGFDEDIRRAVRDEMRRHGIDLRFNTRIASIERSGGALAARFADGEIREADVILYAIGRDPLTHGLGLEDAGIVLAPDGSIPVDAYSRTSVPWIHAIGDVTNRKMLTPVAIEEGMALANTLFGGNPSTPDYEHIPTAVFTRPPVGTVGLTEAEARARVGRVRVYRTRFRPMKYALTNKQEQTMMKLIVDDATDRVLGAHMVGLDAAEIIQGFAVALKCGATKAQFDATVAIHPTSAEEFVTMRRPVES